MRTEGPKPSPALRSPRAIPCDPVRSRAILCDPVRSRAILCDPARSRAIPCDLVLAGYDLSTCVRRGSSALLENRPHVDTRVVEWGQFASPKYLGAGEFAIVHAEVCLNEAT